MSIFFIVNRFRIFYSLSAIKIYILLLLLIYILTCNKIRRPETASYVSTSASIKVKPDGGPQAYVKHLTSIAFAHPRKFD